MESSPRRDLRRILATKMASRVGRGQSADPRGDAGPAPAQGAAPGLSILGTLPDRTEDGGDAGARGGLPRRDPPGAPDPRGGGIRDDARSPRARHGRDRSRAVGHPVLRPADPDRGVRGRSGRGLGLSAAGGHDRRAPRADRRRLRSGLRPGRGVDGLGSRGAPVRRPRPGDRRAARLVLPRPPPPAGQVRPCDGVAGPPRPRRCGRPPARRDLGDRGERATGIGRRSGAAPPRRHGDALSRVRPRPS